MHHGYMHHGYMHHGYMHHGYVHHGYMHHDWIRTISRRVLHTHREAPPPSTSRPFPNMGRRGLRPSLGKRGVSRRRALRSVRRRPDAEAERENQLLQDATPLR